MLPLDAGPQPAAAAARRPVSGESLGGIRVLAVDDDEDAARMIEQMLRFEGATVRIALNAIDAVEAAKSFRPDVLVLDIGMPIEDGYELLPRLRRELGADGRTLPAIALTGFAGASDSERAHAANFQAHVAKPFEMTTVCDLIAALASQARRLR
jgi:CheY-like chemotaxis protein